MRPLKGGAASVLAVVGLLLLGVGCQSRARSPDAEVEPVAVVDTVDEDEAPEHEEIHEHGEAELALHMSRLQRWTHKTALSVEAKNQRLAEFYLHETEETVETIQTEAPTYEGYEIKALSDEYLAPSLAALDEAVEASDWPVAREQLQRVATSCNQCHTATDHGFVRIQLDSLANPYAQSFAPRTDP